MRAHHAGSRVLVAGAKPEALLAWMAYFWFFAFHSS